MKKILFSLFTLTLLFNLSACSAQQHSTTNIKPKIEKTTKKKTIKHQSKKHTKINNKSAKKTETNNSVQNNLTATQTKEPVKTAQNNQTEQDQNN